MDATVGSNVGEHPGQLFVEAGIHGVESIGTIQANGQYAVAVLECDEAVLFVVHEDSKG
ncbi:hypothetical protein D3C81_2228950 [compost metagenome]